AAPAIRRADEGEPCKARYKLRPVACWRRRSFVGDRKCVAHPTQPTFRCSGDRVLGTRPDSAHAVAAFAFKARGLTKNRPAHLELSHFLWLRRFSRRHRFFYFGAEVRESHRRECDPEHPTIHLHPWCVLPV